MFGSGSDSVNKHKLTECWARETKQLTAVNLA